MHIKLNCLFQEEVLKLMSELLADINHCLNEVSCLYSTLHVLASEVVFNLSFSFRITFSYFCPYVWNSLPLHIRNATTIDAFMSAV